MSQNKEKYDQKLVDEVSKVIAEDPLAYEYDAVYD